MKTSISDFIESTKTKIYFCLVLSLALMTACDSNEPEREDVPELITKATLTFTPLGGGQSIVVTATDPDGEGVQDIQVDGSINLAASTTYTLAIALANELALEGSPEFDITSEVAEEADEHLFFFSWTNNIFSDPMGNGNVDNRSDPVNYNDLDDEGLPLGLSTTWATSTASSGTFRVLLKHQPDLKTATSDSNTGETDLDVTFPITIN